MRDIDLRELRNEFYNFVFKFDRLLKNPPFYERCLAMVMLNRINEAQGDWVFIKSVKEVRGSSLYGIIWFRKPSEEELMEIKPAMRNDASEMFTEVQ